MRIPTETDKAAYDKIGKESAAIWNLARVVASQAYSETMKIADQALRAGKIDQAEHIRLMARADNKCDVACNKAERELALTMKQAWQKYILGEPALARQLSFEEVV